MNKEIFIKKSLELHSKYDYSLVDYKNSKTKVKIICPEHGVFEQTPNNHISKSQGCPKCSKVKRLTTTEFILRSIEIHDNKYDYSLVEYINNRTKVKIICIKHGIFEQRPEQHICQKQGCPICNGGIKHTKEKFIEKSNIIHKNKYDYKLVEYINSHTKIKIICPIHGIFEQLPYHHLNNCGCPTCKESKGEKYIRNFLEERNINYIIQKKFENCKDKNKLPFDFYLPDYNICIEYDGRQHYESIDRWNGELGLKDRQNKDEIKNNFCINNGITLIRINYKENIIDKLWVI